MEPLFSEAQLQVLHMLHEDPSAGTLAETIVPFLDDTEALCAALVESLGAGDINRAEHQSHTLKGSAVTFALPRLGQVGAGIEKALRGGDLAAAREQAEPLLSVMAESRAEWERRLEEGRGKQK